MKAFICGAALMALPALISTAPARAETISAAQLSDREEIRTLLLNYGRYLDDRQLESYADLFAQEGEWVGGFGSAKGPAQILAVMKRAFADLPSPPENRNYHILTNMIVDTDGDRGTAWSRWTFYVKGPDNKPVEFGAGRYEDELIRENGKWKFLRRVVAAEIPYGPPKEGKAPS